MVELFNAAGFETYWISNKAFITKYGVSYGVIAHQAKQVYDLSFAKTTDEIVLPSLREVLSEDVPGNKIIFIHLMGNHQAYNLRYTDDFNRFDHEQDQDLADLGFRNQSMKQVIDDYDNSILYGDFLYESIYKELNQLDASACLLFFPDHGDEVYDYRAVAGHLMANVYPCQCQIPFVLWRSEKYKAENPDIVIDPNRPYSIENVIYSISTLTKLDYADYDPTLSLFTPEYLVPDHRIVGKEYYDAILKKVKK
jgi:heptose-I-phosphate ethanolaminephosphotransferase